MRPAAAMADERRTPRADNASSSGDRGGPAGRGARVRCRGRPSGIAARKRRGRPEEQAILHGRWPEPRCAKRCLIHEDGRLDAALFPAARRRPARARHRIHARANVSPQLCLVQLATETDCLPDRPAGGARPRTLPPSCCRTASELKFHARGRTWKCRHARAAARCPGPLFDTQVAAALLGFPHRWATRNSSRGSSGIPSTRDRRAPTGQATALASAARLCRRRRAPPARAASRAGECAGRAGPRRLGRGGDGRLEDPPLPHRPGCRVEASEGTKPARPQEQAVARALAAWRERRAIESDKPRSWILTDEALYAMRRARRSRFRRWKPSSRCRPASCQAR